MNPRELGKRILPLALALALSACDKKPPTPPKPPAPPPAPPKVEEPPPVAVDALAQELKADARVQFPAERAPGDEGLARAVIQLADSIARGDSARLRAMLDRPAQAILDQITAGDDWRRATMPIEVVRVVRVQPMGDSGAMVALAVQDPAGAYVMGWAARPTGSSWIFGSMPTTSAMLRRAADFDKEDLGADMKASMSDDVIEAAKKAAKDAGIDPKVVEQAIKKGDDGTIRKNTPGGPINIPTKSPGGG
ncbi:MAG: hypothetical protein JNM07_01080 [Phycisphaerae bacterium]|nr:hypothetical protein [Phycisphaerae bacterium]